LASPRFAYVRARSAAAASEADASSYVWRKASFFDSAQPRRALSRASTASSIAPAASRSSNVRVPMLRSAEAVDQVIPATLATKATSTVEKRSRCSITASHRQRGPGV
jgi:hypothetical protein